MNMFKRASNKHLCGLLFAMRNVTKIDYPPPENPMLYYRSVKEDCKKDVLACAHDTHVRIPVYVYILTEIKIRRSYSLRFQGRNID
jgi:hypothetical protein